MIYAQCSKKFKILILAISAPPLLSSAFLIDTVGSEQSVGRLTKEVLYNASILNPFRKVSSKIISKVRWNSVQNFS